MRCVRHHGELSDICLEDVYCAAHLHKVDRIFLHIRTTQRSENVFR